MTRRYDNIIATVGNTPVVRINKLAPAHVNLYAKLEAFNPMGSVKDRLALGVIEDAERSGALKPGQTVVEATSGNTGIGLAMVCAQKGYPLVVVMAENFSVERRRLMRFLGARVVLTPAAEMGTGMLAKATELAATHGWFLCRQFENEANADIHSATTAPEILEAFEGETLDYFVSGYGTGGTLKGIARVLKQRSPATRIIACEPDNSPLLGSGQRQARQADGSPADSHPAFRPHVMQGWTPNFISPLTEHASEWVDQVVPVPGSDALRLSRELARKEGIFCGITAGATFAAALKIAETAAPGSNILCILPDTGERYLSTPLFDDIDAEMNAEEWEISRSTPGYRFDTAPAPEPEPGEAPAEPTQVTVAARDFVNEAIANPEQPVVMFALEWCEFCWSVRKLFAKLGIEYRSIDLDSAALQQDDWGGQVRAALEQRTGCVTIPQIFIGGEFIGGCSDTLAACADGSLAARLANCGAAFTDPADFDPNTLLPRWVHRRAS